MESLAGKLLVAAPTLQDPNFARTVVLLLDHDEDGAFGVVLNRPSGLSAREALPRWADLVSEPGVVHVGGPVTPEAVVCLARVRAEAAAEGWTPLAGSLGAIDLESEPDGLVDVLDGLRVFAGYAGWAAGQLETELRLGGWLVCAAEPDDAFTAQPESLWARVLRRQGGEIALLATMPTDPTCN
ncbi:MAG: YqgE/AlgH family protein [Acidothermus sp.]|nr:YqgE/AlgH family protein [Acidothermus sp.]